MRRKEGREESKREEERERERREENKRRAEREKGNLIKAAFLDSKTEPLVSRSKSSNNKKYAPYTINCTQ